MCCERITCMRQLYLWHKFNISKRLCKKNTRILYYKMGTHVLRAHSAIESGFLAKRLYTHIRCLLLIVDGDEYIFITVYIHVFVKCEEKKRIVWLSHLFSTQTHILVFATLSLLWVLPFIYIANVDHITHLTPNKQIRNFSDRTVSKSGVRKLRVSHNNTKKNPKKKKPKRGTD